MFEKLDVLPGKKTTIVGAVFAALNVLQMGGVVPADTTASANQLLSGLMSAALAFKTMRAMRKAGGA